MPLTPPVQMILAVFRAAQNATERSALSEEESTSWQQRSRLRHRRRHSAAKPWYKVLYVQVLIAIVLGALVGWLWPDLADQ